MNKEFSEDLIKLVNSLKGLVKSKSVSFKAVKFDYVPLDEILEIIKKNNNFALLQPLGQVDGVSTIKNILVHKSGEFIESGDFPLQIPSTKMQDVGSVITYSRRYSLGSFLGIATETDLDASVEVEPEIKKATQKQIDELTVLASPEYFIKVKEYYLNNGVNDLLNADYETIEKAIEKCKADAKV